MDQFARRANLDTIPNARAAQGVMRKGQTFDQGHAHVVCKFHWCGTCPAFCSVDDDEIRRDICFQHRANDTHKFAAVTDTHFEPDRFSA